MTSLYGKLRTQAVHPPAAAVAAPRADAPATTTTDDVVAGDCGSSASSAGTALYGGWKGRKVATSVLSTDTSSTLLQPDAAATTNHSSSSAAATQVPFQYSLFSTSSSNAGSRSNSSRTSSMGSRSTASTAAAAAAGADQLVPQAGAFDAAAPASSSADGQLGGTLGLFGANIVADSTASEQALLSLLLRDQAGCAAAPDVYTHAQQTTSTAAAQALAAARPSSGLDDTSFLLEQLQQLCINEAAVLQAQPTQFNPSPTPDAGSFTPTSFGSVQQQLLMQQLRDLQTMQGQPAMHSSADQLLGSLDPASAAGAHPALLPAHFTSGAGGYSFQHCAAGHGPVSGSSMLLGLGAQHLQQQQHPGASSQIMALDQLLAQLAPGSAISSSCNSNSMAAGLSNPHMAAGAPAGPMSAGTFAMPSTTGGPSAVTVALEGLKHKLLLSSGGMAPAPAPPAPVSTQGVFGSLAGLAAATAVAGDLAGLLRAGKHTLQAGPGSNPMYKTELCRTWLETGGCRYGAGCQFAHGPHELRPVPRHPKYKTQPCRTFSMTGSCPYGDRCNFIHDHQLQVSHPVLLPQASDSTSTSSGLVGGGSSGPGSMMEPVLSLS